MNSLFIFKVFVLCALLGVQNVVAAPKHRIKRGSDSHLANVETNMALNKVKGVVVTMPIGGGRLDPARIGRKRRSQTRFLDVLFNQSEEEKNTSERDRIEYNLLLDRLRSLL